MTKSNFKIVKVTAEPNNVDFMHLTEEGHRQLAEALSEIIPEILSCDTTL